MIENLPIHKQLILFDGVCNLCNTSVQFVIQNDKKNQFVFAALESSIGQKIISHYNIDTSKLDSILLYSRENGLSIKSTAALTIAKQLNSPVNLLGLCLVIPSFIRDKVYDFIAKNRYKWFGKKEVCMIPAPELKSKFL